MKPRARSTKQELVIFVLFSGAMLIGMAVLFILPTIGSIKRDYAEFRKAKEEVERLLNEGSTKELLERHVRDLRDELNELESGFIVPGREVDFITFLEKAGAARNVEQTIQLNEPKFTPTTDFFRSALLTLKVAGSFLDLLGYLTDLERSPYYMNVASLTIVKGREDAFFGARVLEGGRVVPADEKVRDEQGESSLEETLSIILIGEVFWQHER